MKFDRALFNNVLRVLLISGLITAVGNYLGYKINPIEAIPGLLILIAISIGGWVLSKIIPIDLPAVAYISLLGIIISIPGVPGADFVIASVAKVNFLAICTPVLAYAGISIGKDLAAFKTQGVKIVIVALLTFTGTFVGSAIIAEIIMRLTGQI